jgi:nicotinamide-nucleotide amidase
MDSVKMFINNELARLLINKCKAKNYKLSIAESCTGGLISSVITSVPGSSDIFDCSFITYSNRSKKKFLNVSENNLNLFGAVSKEVVIDMINGLKKNTDSDVLLAISGVAGPGGGTINKPEGLVWISYALKNNIVNTSKLEFGPIGRDLVREKSTIQSLKFLLSLLGD